MNSFAFSIGKNATSFIPFDEVYKLNKNNLKNVTEKFQKELDKEEKLQGYIINYGTAKEIAKHEKIIRDSIAFRRFDASRITIVSGGYNQTKTIFYLVPLNAEELNYNKDEETK